MNTNETPPPSPAGYGPAFKGDGQNYEGKRHWMFVRHSTNQWEPAYKLISAASDTWYCKPLTEGEDVRENTHDAPFKLTKPSSIPPWDSPAPGETKGAQLTTELGWLVAWGKKQTRPVDAKLAYKEGYIDAVNIMDSLYQIQTAPGETTKPVSEGANFMKNKKHFSCVSEQGKSGLLWTVFDGEPFFGQRIASFSDAEYARNYLIMLENLAPAPVARDTMEGG